MGSNKKNKIAVAFVIFLGLMWLCTVISKSVYASRLPIVSTESIEQKYVEHIVEVDGIVVAGDKNPVTALGGLRIDKLMVQVGDRVEEGDVIFTVDMEDLNNIMEEKQTAISKLQVQIDTILQNEELARQQKELQEQRAREDYDALAQRQDTLVGRAAEEYSKLEDEIDKQRYEEIERRRREAEERRKAERENNTEDNEDYSDDSEGYYDDSGNYYGGDENYDGGIVDEALLEALQQAAYAEADAEWERENAMKEAGRKVEDTLAPDNEDSSLEVSRLELADLQADLSRFREIRDAEGQIRTGRSGLVTDIYISIGGRTSDSAVMLLADDSVPCQFKAVISQEQKKYVRLNDQVSLKLDGSGREKDATIDYLSESDSMPGSYEVYINLPEGIGVPGLSGTMSRSENGEKHTCCVTPSAVHKEEVRNYVYVVKERDGILGKEYYAEQVNVRILDENDRWVAVEGALDKESVIISSSTKEVKNGDVVRLSE